MIERKKVGVGFFLTFPSQNNCRNNKSWQWHFWFKKKDNFFQKQFNSFDFDFEIYSRKNKTKQKKFHFDIPHLFCWIDLYQANKSFIFLFSVNFTIQPPIILINFIQVGNPITHIFIVCPLNEWMNAICCCCDSNPEWSLCWKYFQKKN